MNGLKKSGGLFVLLFFVSTVLARSANADGITFHFSSPTEQSVVVGSSLTQVVFDGYITNDTQAPISFALITPSPESPYVASVVSPFPYPGITLPVGGSTASQALATVTFNLFDPSLQYPGVANIVLEAETLQGNIITQTNLTLHVLSEAVPEPSPLTLVGVCCFGLLAFFALRRGGGTSLYYASNLLAAGCAAWLCNGSRMS